MKIRLFIIFLVLATMAIALTSGFILVWRLLLVTAVVLLLSYFWTVLSARGLEITSQPLPSHFQAGDSFEREFRLVNHSRIPQLLLRAREDSDLPGYENASLFNLLPKRSYRWRSKVVFQRRGQYHLGSIAVSAGDPFGLFTRHRTMGESQILTVCPATAELPHFDLTARDGARAGSGSGRASYISSNASGVREYVAGDSLKHVHWPTTAHTGKLLVRLFDPDASRNVARTMWIAVDMHGASHAGNTGDNTADCCATVAASLIKKYLDAGWSVGLLARAERPYLFPPATGEQRYWQMLEALAMMQPQGETPIEQLITEESLRFGSHTALVVVSPSSSERLASSLLQVKNHVGLLVAVLLDAAGFTPDGSSPGNNRRPNLRDVMSYTVRLGDELPRALDSRRIHADTASFPSSNRVSVSAR